MRESELRRGKRKRVCVRGRETEIKRKSEGQKRGGREKER